MKEKPVDTLAIGKHHCVVGAVKTGNGVAVAISHHAARMHGLDGACARLLAVAWHGVVRDAAVDLAVRAAHQVEDGLTWAGNTLARLPLRYLRVVAAFQQKQRANVAGLENRGRSGQRHGAGLTRGNDGHSLVGVDVLERPTGRLKQVEHERGRAGALQDPGLVERMRDVQEVAGLGKTQAAGAVRGKQVCQRVGRRHLDGCGARNELTVLRVEPDILVAELQHISLILRELEGLQPYLLLVVLDAGHIARAAATHGGALHRGDEVLHQHAAVLVSVKIDAPLQQRRELSRVEVGQCR